MAGSRQSLRTTSEWPGSDELSVSHHYLQGKSQEHSYEPGGSDVVRELSHEPAMPQIGLWSEVLSTAPKSSLKAYL